MYPRTFSYAAAASVDEAVALLAGSPGARILAGGASLVPLLKLRLVAPALVIDIGRIPGLDQVRDAGGHISVGPMVTHAAAAADPLLATHAAALAEAAGVVGDAQVRNQGTVGGSLAHADSVGDEPGAAVALAATMVARSTRGERQIAAADFFVDTLTSALEPDEMLTEIRIPKAGPGEASAYDKLGRRGGRSDYPVAGAAAWVRRSNGQVIDARVAVTGAGTKPALLPAVAARLVSGGASPEAVAEAARGAAAEMTVLADIYGSVGYKGHLVEVYLQRAVLAALGRALDL